jgi:hypothetical protein
MLKHVVCVVRTVLETVRIHIWQVEVSGCTEMLGAHPLVDCGKMLVRYVLILIYF